MTKKKETLIYTVITSVAFLALSYLFGIVISFECSWFSNEFLFVIFSGAFASSLVVLISEIFGYRQLKKVLENELYSHTVCLYAAAKVAKNTMTAVIENKEIHVVPDLLDQQQYQISSALNCIFNLDYSIFCKKQELSVELTAFKGKYSSYMTMMRECAYLRMSINQTQIDELMKNPCFRGPINTTYPLVLKTAQILQKHFDTIISDCEKLLDKVDYSGRFDWKARKENVSQVNSIDLEDGSLENFFKRNL